MLFPVGIMRCGAGKCECFIMQMYVSVLCASCGSSQ